ncbi:hypothetical protein STEG23_025684 [Scotinomys teguina]
MEVVAAALRCQLLLIVLMAAMLLPGMKGSPLLVWRKIARTIELQESIGKGLFCSYMTHFSFRVPSATTGYILTSKDSELGSMNKRKQINGFCFLVCLAHLFVLIGELKLLPFTVTVEASFVGYNILRLFMSWKVFLSSSIMADGFARSSTLNLSPTILPSA